jgi:hypothetical protein
MPTQHEEIFAALARPFDPSEVKERSQGGRKLSYITARTAANRLDEVLGCEHWKQEYRETRNGLICRLWYRLGPDQEWNWKEDGGGYAGMAEQDNDVKSGLSDAFKRAAAMLGVGRSLYKDGIPHYGEVPNAPAPAPQRQQYQAEPRQGGRRQQEANGRQGGQQRDYGDGPPTTGRALFKVLKDHQEGGASGLIDDVNAFLKSKGIRARLVDLDRDQVAMAYDAAMQMLHGGQPDPEPMPAMAGGGTDEDEDGSDIPF